MNRLLIMPQLSRRCKHFLRDFLAAGSYTVKGVGAMIRVFLGWTQQPFRTYIAALERIGVAVERQSADDCDALLLPGGCDVNPRRYGQKIANAEGIDNARDVFEIALLQRFLDEGKPILGICRGMQLINVALGGTLRQHIYGHSRLDGTDRLHMIRATDPLLRAVYGKSFTVNSAHHQCVARLGDGLKATAWAADGTIEALRHETLPVFAVQWHPERLGAEGDRMLSAFFGAAD